MEQLLLRERIILDSANIEKYILEKRVLITGAAGSIGSELLKQLIAFDPAHLLAIDQNEKGIHELQANFTNSRNASFKIANITDTDHMSDIFRHFRPQVVFHAAAYKHVHLLESQPQIAVKNNTIGTKLLADLALENGVEKFIFISTDKAVNPISIMGMSKRVSELYLLSLNEKSPLTQFVITRFGNVLGSSGSVVPTFIECVEREKPIMVTSPDATRYFMTIGEAAQLVLESAAIGKGGEIMTFDMGEPVLIVDLAHRVIKIYNRSNTGKRIEIFFIGLRPGEKMHEELHHNFENVCRDHHSKMKILKTDTANLTGLSSKINSLHDELITSGPDELPSILRNFFDQN